MAVARAVASGTLTRGPCAVCGALKVHGHHGDYSKPLDVVWLCPPHHRQLHVFLKGEAMRTTKDQRGGLSHSELRWLATKANVDIRSLMKAIAGEPVRGMAGIRVKQALRKMKEVS